MRKSSRLGDYIIELSEIDSTNNYAIKLLGEGMAEHGLCIRADWQSQGKGQLGNTWISEESKNVLMSVVIDTARFPIELQYHMNAMTCLALTEFLMADLQVRDISIKWPNDIYSGARKLSGVLIENIIRGSQWSHAILGIGLNLNQTRFPDLNRATSVRNETGKSLKVNHACRQILKQLNKSFEQFCANPQAIFEEYNRNLYRIHQTITLKKNNEIFQATMRGVSSQGELEVEQEGKIRRYRHKEIEIVMS